MEIKIRKFEEKDIVKVLPLFERIYSSDRLEQYIRWKYFENPFSNIIKSFIALKDDEIIGFRGWFPSVYTLGKKDLYLPLASDAFVYPKYNNPLPKLLVYLNSSGNWTWLYKQMSPPYT